MFVYSKEFVLTPNRSSGRPVLFLCCFRAFRRCLARLSASCLPLGHAVIRPFPWQTDTPSARQLNNTGSVSDERCGLNRVQRWVKFPKYASYDKGHFDFKHKLIVLRHGRIRFLCSRNDPIPGVKMCRVCSPPCPWLTCDSLWSHLADCLLVSYVCQSYPRMAWQGLEVHRATDKSRVGQSSEFHLCSVCFVLDGLEI